MIECRFYNLWNSLTKFRKDLSGKSAMAWGSVPTASSHPRGAVRPLHEPHMPIRNGRDGQAGRACLFHLQWTM